MNEIVFPAGILQPPFFDPKADDALNYGGMGAVIGHELTHGFDDQGRQYDAQGNLRDWWTPEDLKNFQARAACIEKQFSAFVVQGDLHAERQAGAGRKHRRSGRTEHRAHGAGARAGSRNAQAGGRAGESGRLHAARSAFSWPLRASGPPTRGPSTSA